MGRELGSCAFEGIWLLPTSRREASAGSTEFAGKRLNSLSEAIEEELGPSELLVCRVVMELVKYSLGEEGFQDCLREETSG